MPKPTSDVDKELREALFKQWPWPSIHRSVVTPIIRFYDPTVKATDAHGRSLNQILQWDDEHLERSHDYIQILFPLPEESMFAYNVPILDEKTLIAFLVRMELRYRLTLAFHRMLHFYGFKMVEVSEPVKEGEVQEPESSKANGGGEQKVPDKKGKGKAKADDLEQTTTQPEPIPKGLNVGGCINPECFATHRIDRGDNWAKASRNWTGRMIDHNHLRITRILRSLRLLGLQCQADLFYDALRRVYVAPDTKIGKRTMEFWQRAMELPFHTAPDGQEIDWLRNLDLRQVDPSLTTSG